ncbi:MAG: UvrD-helicase domain-containing protein [Anaerolineae bacterium]|nr:UvrD-helicase domain-containing protein [Anaerolineae bacterium]
MTESPLLAGLNPPQREAVTAGPGPVLVLAGPGSGKTRVLTHRVAYLIRDCDVSPFNLLAVTFTNKAAHEMSDRIARLLGDTPRGVQIGTFHATCARILRVEADFTPFTREYVIFDTSDQRAAIQAAIEELGLDPKRYRPSAVHSKISAAKNELIAPSEFQSGSYFDEVVGRIYARYQELLVENNAMDFDDLLSHTVTLFREHPDVLARYRRRYQWVLVDEFQDTNTVQYALLKLLTHGEGSRNLFVVGDEDQSIYLFRGADYRNVRRFEEDYPERVKILLEQNYRSTQHILDVANAVIQHNRDRTPKHLFTERERGPRITVHDAYNENDEAAFITETIKQLTQGLGKKYALRDIAVMYRTNAQSRALEDAFMLAGLPYRLINATRFYSRREIEDLIAYLRIVYNPEDAVSMARIINTPPRRIGTKTVGILKVWADIHDTSLYRAIMAHLDGPEPGAKADGGAGVAPPPLTAGAARNVRAFAELLARWQAQRAEKDRTPLDWLDQIIEQVEYRAYVYDGTVEGQERWENVQELRNIAAGYEGASLGDFLEEVALVSDVDTRDDEADAPSLMTLHAAKGLEFPVVFIVGLEEGMLPHTLSMDSPEAMAEERRLMYVGVTRAQDLLYLSYAFRRMRWGDTEVNEPSRFLKDIPVELVEGNARLHLTKAKERASYQAEVAWEPAPAPASSQETQFRTGERVNHPSFGVGVVVESAPSSGGDEMVTVAFADIGIKKLMASFAKLKKL